MSTLNPKITRPCILRDRLTNVSLQRIKRILSDTSFTVITSRAYLSRMFVIRYTEVFVLIPQDVAWICINSEDSIRIVTSEVFISSEWTSVRVTIRTSAKALISLRAVLHASMTHDSSRVSLTFFFGRSTSKRVANPTKMSKISIYCVDEIFCFE